MAYNKQYSHKDYEAFWRKDYSADIHNCRSYVASIIHGQGFSKERADRMVEEELVKLYPQGFSTNRYVFWSVSIIKTFPQQLTLQGFLRSLRHAAVIVRNLFPASPPDHFPEMFCVYFLQRNPKFVQFRPLFGKGQIRLL